MIKQPTPTRPFLRILATGFSSLAFLLLSGCIVPVDTGGMNYDPVQRHNYSGTSPDAYRKGYQFGRSDARQGRNHNYVRYGNEYTSLTKSQFAEGYMKAYNYYSNGGGNNNGNDAYNYRASVEQGQVRILSNGRTVSVIRPAMPNVEQQRFINGNREIVIKSRGNHGPATIERFDTKTGTLRGKVMAYAITNGQPVWARGMKD